MIALGLEGKKWKRTMSIFHGTCKLLQYHMMVGSESFNLLCINHKATTKITQQRVESYKSMS